MIVSRMRAPLRCALRLAPVTSSLARLVRSHRLFHTRLSRPRELTRSKPRIFRLQRHYAAAACSDSNWAELVEKGSHAQPVIVDFTAAWCGPCRVLGPLLETEVANAGGVTLAAYDIDESSERAEEFRVSAVPSVFAFSKGKKVAEFKGAIPAPMVQQFINQVKQLHEKS